MNAVIIAIGDELLLGKTVNNNAAHLSRRLAAAGVPTRRQLVVGDTPAEITAAFTFARELATLVVTTGGLGPTADDRTLAPFAAFLGRELVLHQPTLKSIEGQFARRRMPMPAVNVGQARVPADARVLRNPLGTAPGIITEDRGVVYCLLPGVPAEMEYLCEHGLLPYLEEKGFVGERTYEWQLGVIGLPESAVAEKVGGLTIPPGINLAYLPQVAQVDLRIWGTAPDEETFRDRARPFADALGGALGNRIFGEGGEALEKVVGRMLAARGATLGLAESCTGGLIAKRLTDVPGASAWFRGGIVSYANDVKTDVLDVPADLLTVYGAVSEEVAKAMAEGARRRLGATYGLAVTGIAGPSGGTPAKPVGTVCVARAAEGTTAGETVIFGGGRDWVRLRASQQALDFLRHFLLEKGV